MNAATRCNRNSERVTACLGLNTEILTEHGWKSYDQVIAGELAWSVNPHTRELFLSEITGVVVRAEERLLTAHLSGFQTASSLDHIWVDSDGVTFTSGEQQQPRKLLRVEDLFARDFAYNADNPLAVLAGVVARWGLLQVADDSSSITITMRDLYSNSAIDDVNMLIDRCFIGGLTSPDVGFELDARTATWTIRGATAEQLGDMAFMPYPLSAANARALLAGYCLDMTDPTQSGITEESEYVLDKVQHCAVLAGYRTYIRQHRSQDNYIVKFFRVPFNPEIRDVLNITDPVEGGTVWSPTLESGFWIARIRNDAESNTPYANYVSPAFITGCCNAY